MNDICEEVCYAGLILRNATHKPDACGTQIGSDVFNSPLCDICSSVETNDRTRQSPVSSPGLRIT